MMPSTAALTNRAVTPPRSARVLPGPPSLPPATAAPLERPTPGNYLSSIATAGFIGAAVGDQEPCWTPMAVAALPRPAAGGTGRHCDAAAWPLRTRASPASR